MGSWKLWGGNSALGRKLGARMGLWMSEFTDGTGALRELSISCPKKVVGAAGGAAGPVGATRGSEPGGSTMSGETEHRGWGSDLGTTDWKTGLGCSTYGAGSKPGTWCR